MRTKANAETFAHVRADLRIHARGDSGGNVSPHTNGCGAHQVMKQTGPL